MQKMVRSHRDESSPCLFRFKLIRRKAPDITPYAPSPKASRQVPKAFITSRTMKFTRVGDTPTSFAFSRWVLLCGQSISNTKSVPADHRQKISLTRSHLLVDSLFLRGSCVQALSPCLR
ncbi:hypothetical protein BA022_09160 [Diaphorobacter nitroreducens]|nr:hypothetical protein BA022_09160 [Diaphorobacter nitroreducens]